jgi:cation-transporting ATPase 13A2
VLNYYSQKGLRVLGLATKHLKQFQFIKETTRDDLEDNLEFIGFMMMENKLKSVTK